MMKPKSHFFTTALLAMTLMMSTGCVFDVINAFDNLVNDPSKDPENVFRMQDMPDPRICRPTRPPTPRATGNTHTNSVGMKFTLVKPGDLVMGDKGYPTSITRPYYMAVSLVTERQWTAVMGTPVDIFEHASRGVDHPVAPVNWYEAQDFINRLNEKEGTNRYRLPTEAEWELAARSGHEMKGNNPEWCSDWYDKDYFSRMPAADPWGPVQSRDVTGKVVRMGAWASRGVDRLGDR
jgi:formylglycine-generating enzyme required for sulfatase activity